MTSAERFPVPLLLLAAALLSGCGRADTAAERPGSPADSLGPRPVKVAAVELRDFQPTFEATGTLVPARQAELRALVDGQLEVVAVDIGRRIKAGQLLFQIRTVDYRIALEQAEANLARAEAQLRDRERERDRMAGLHAEGSATAQARDQAITAHEEAAAGLKQAQAARDMARQALSDATVAAPYSGVITLRHHQKGEWVGKGDPVVEIMDLGVLNAELEIPERHAGTIREGLAVEMLARATNHRVTGNVVAVNPKVDAATRTFRVKVAVDNRDGQLQAGLFVSATFRLPTAAGQLAVPASALIRDEGRTRVWAVREGKTVSRDIATGADLDGWVQVVGGLEAGELVVVEGGGGLVEGIPVRVEGGSVAASGS